MRLIKFLFFILLFIISAYSQERDSLKIIPDSAQIDIIKADKIISVNFDSINSSFFSSDTIYRNTLYNLNLEYLSDGLVLKPSFFRYTAGEKNSPSYLTAYGLPERFFRVTFSGFEMENFFNRKKLMNIVPVNAVEKIYDSNTGINDINLEACKFQGGVPVSNIVYGIGTQDTSSVDITFARDFSSGYRLFASGSTKTLPYKTDDASPYSEVKIFSTIDKNVLNGKYKLKFDHLQYRSHSRTISEIYKINPQERYDTHLDEGIFMYKLNLSAAENNRYGADVFLTENKTRYRNNLFDEDVKLNEKRFGADVYYRFINKDFKMSARLGAEKIKNSLFFTSDKNNNFKTGRIFGEFTVKKSLKKHNLSLVISGNHTKLFGFEKSLNLSDIYKINENLEAYFHVNYKGLKNYLEKLSLASKVFETNNNLKDESALVVSAGTRYFNWKNFKAELQVFNVNWKNPVYYYLRDEKYAVTNSDNANCTGISLFLQRYLTRNLDASVFCSGNFYEEDSPVLIPKASIFSVIRLREIEDIIYKYPLHSEIIFTANYNLDAKKLINYPYFNRFILLEDSKFSYIVLNLRILLKIKRFTFFYQINNLNYQKYSLILHSPGGIFDKKYGVNWTFYN